MLSELKRRISNTSEEGSALLPATLILVLGSFGYMLYTSTHVYLMEQSVCREYYRAHEPTLVGKNGLMDETICKIPQIQSRVAETLGVYRVLTYLPALFMAGPYGKIARTIGKKPVMYMNLISYTLAGAYFTVICYNHEVFDVRWIYLTPLFDILGGGDIILSSFSYTYISESIEQRRLSAFYYKLSAGQFTFSFLALCLSSILLRKHVYIQCILGGVTLGATIPLCCMLPGKDEVSAQSSETSSLLSTTPPITPLAMDPEDGALFWTIVKSLGTNAKHSLSIFRDLRSSSSLFRTTMFTFFMLTVGYGIKVVFIQWPSLTYGWMLADVHAIISYETVISAIILLTLPTVSHKVLKPRLGDSVSEVDLFVAKISAAAHVLGILCAGFAPGKVSYILALTVWKLGNGLNDALRSYVTGLLERKEDVEQLYLGIGMVETLGGMIATAAWTSLFAKVLGKGYLVLRLPFMISSVILLICCACIWVLGRFGPKKPKGAVEA
ncbi:hypothetical protein BKA65DRAFT_231744 [Rhexocercosporidium sp. MPI-PUGE-AT-0058]|nr:hypothetical protein BKA65DRAFT_231744 [Rhexocercosporidium sp. MPI-PUGE-AT-0058]